MNREAFMQALSVVKIIAEIGVGVGAIYAAISAGVAFRRWQKQRIWETKFEAVQKVAKLARKFEKEFIAARPGLDYLPEDKADDPKYRIRRRLEYLEPARQTLLELEEAMWEAEISLEEDLTPRIDPLGSAFLQVKNAIPIVLGQQPLPGSLEHLQDIVYARSKEDDELSQEVKSTVDDLLEHLKEAVEIKSFLR